MKILITGASGIIGTHLTKLLLSKGHEVAHLGRKKTHNENVVHFKWDLEKETMDLGAATWADAIVHLAGANVSESRWTSERKKEIIDSRKKGPALLSKILRHEKNIPKVFISASGVGWYGCATTQTIFKENDLPAKDFLAEVCQNWEAAADLMEETGMRVVKLRIGVVLAKEGGALPKLSAPVKWFVGSPIASGKQWMPWIHIDDLCELFLKAIADVKMTGVYNAVSSDYITNKDLVNAIGKVLHRPVFFPRVPAFALKMRFGEMAEIITGGSRVSNEKLLQTGVVLKYNNLSGALKNLLEEKK